MINQVSMFLLKENLVNDVFYNLLWICIYKIYKTSFYITYNCIILKYIVYCYFFRWGLSLLYALLFGLISPIGYVHNVSVTVPSNPFQVSVFVLSNFFGIFNWTLYSINGNRLFSFHFPFLEAILWKAEWKPSILMDWIKGSVQNSEKLTKYLKKAGGFMAQMWV